MLQKNNGLGLDSVQKPQDEGGRVSRVLPVGVMRQPHAPRIYRRFVDGIGVTALYIQMSLDSVGVMAVYIHGSSGFQSAGVLRLGVLQVRSGGGLDTTPEEFWPFFKCTPLERFRCWWITLGMSGLYDLS
jgi:hypothetical protein